MREGKKFDGFDKGWEIMESNSVLQICERSLKLLPKYSARG